MRIVGFEGHAFEKQNLVTTRKGDLYKCSECGASGFRLGLEPYVKLTEENFKLASKCKSARSNRPVMVSVDYMPHVGLIAGNYEVQPCPEQYKDKFEDDVWVYSDKRQECVRLLIGEYTVVNP